MPERKTNFVVEVVVVVDDDVVVDVDHDVSSRCGLHQKNSPNEVKS